jgi:hypothetical protein
MKLRELVNKIDNDIVLWIVRAPDTNVLFKRKHPFDVIPENVLCMEVGTFFPSYNRMYIEVKRNAGNGSFRELLNHLNNYDCIDVYVVNRDGAKEKVYSDQAVLRTNEEYDNYLVKRISPHESEWGDKIEIEIEPCEEMKENEKE